MIRKGYGQGRGKGYYNMLPMDSYIHSLSAKGKKLHLPYDRTFEPDYREMEGEKEAMLRETKPRDYPKRMDAKGTRLNAMFKVGQKVRVASDNDNENYDKFRGKVLTITHKITSSKQHPAFDEGMKGQGLYDFVDEDGNEVPFALYDYELEEV